MILNMPEGERDIVSPRIDQCLSRQCKLLAGSQLIFSSVECAARNATLMFADRVMVFDQAPQCCRPQNGQRIGTLPRREHDEIAPLGTELRKRTVFWLVRDSTSSHRALARLQ
jgi:hypothetical protein